MGNYLQWNATIFDRDFVLISNVTTSREAENLFTEVREMFPDAELIENKRGLRYSIDLHFSQFDKSKTIALMDFCYKSGITFNSRNIISY